MLSVNVADAVGMVDVPPGGGGEPAPAGVPILDRFVPMHDKPGRTVTEADLPRVMEEAELMHRMCFAPFGMYMSAHAIAHTQIDDKDPLTFFVTANGEIIVNPRIISHTKVPVESKEGCMTMPDRAPIKVKRYNVITAEFQTIQKNEDGTFCLTPVQQKEFTGKVSMIFQHETAHGLGHCIYQDVISPEDCLDKASAPE